MPTSRQSQFSLKALMLAATLIAIGFGILAYGDKALGPRTETRRELIQIVVYGVPGAVFIALGASQLIKPRWAVIVLCAVVGFAAMRVLR